MEYELVDEATGRPLAVLDLAWPEGLQPGLSQPVAILLDEAIETEQAANAAGYRFFVNIPAFKEDVTDEFLGGSEDIVEQERA